MKYIIIVIAFFSCIQSEKGKCNQDLYQHSYLPEDNCLNSIVVNRSGSSFDREIKDIVLVYCLSSIRRKEQCQQKSDIIPVGIK